MDLVSLKLWIGLAGVAGLIYLDRERGVRVSKALWLPVIWVWILGSRPLASWLGMSPPAAAPGEPPPAASSIDQFLTLSLVLAGIGVLMGRRRTVLARLGSSWPVVLYFAVCLVSLSWSDAPAWGFKRWFRALGDLLMVLVVVTDAQPYAALRRLFSRVGFVLLPVSALLIKYDPDVGRGWNRWGFPANVGVTDNKNTLGLITFVASLGALWQILALLVDKRQPYRTRRLFAQSALLASGLAVLFLAHSATSTACFALGAALMLTTALPLFRRRTLLVHALVLLVLAGGGLSFLLGSWTEAVHTLGRNSDLTGRTDIWKVVSGMASDPILGAGFETFWSGERFIQMNRVYPGINEAHNGYLEVYLNLGCLGLGLIGLILVYGYHKAVAAFRQDAVLGGLLIAYTITVAMYGISEAGFRMCCPAWVFLLLAAVSGDLPKRRVRAGRPQAAPAPASPWSSGWYIASPTPSRVSKS